MLLKDKDSISNIDRLLKICDIYNPHTFEYADNETDGTWLYDALSLPLKEELDKAKTYQDRLNTYAIVEYLWAPISIADC